MAGIPLFYQVSYMIVATVAVIGNSLIVYATVRSKSLRSTCNVLIALMSFADVVQALGQHVLVISYNILPHHVMPYRDCVYWQLLPNFGIFFSISLLFCVAIDRLLSIHLFCVRVIQKYKKVYTAGHVIAALAYSLTFIVWMIAGSFEDRNVVCSITVPWIGIMHLVVTRSIFLINILVIVCYALFLMFIKRAKMGSDTMRNIYKTLIVISLSVILGWLSTNFVGTFAPVFGYSRMEGDMMAGLFVNTSNAVSFFIYYAISAEYRLVFQKHIFCGICRRDGVSLVKPATEMTRRRAPVVSTMLTIA